MTRDQYHAIVEDYELHQFNLAVDKIPYNINRAGKLYKKSYKR